jgi:hypothetical protein
MGLKPGAPQPNKGWERHVRKSGRVHKAALLRFRAGLSLHADMSVGGVTVLEPGRQLLEALGKVRKDFLRLTVLA